MKLVLLFFCAILIFILTILLLVLFSSIKLNIVKLSVSNIDENRRRKHIDADCLVYLEFYLLGLLKIARIRITKKLLKKVNIKKDPKSVKKDIKVIKKVHPIEILKKLKIKIQKANLDLEFGTESVMLTVYLITAISSLIGIAFRGLNHDNSNFKIIPLYNFGNSIKINLNCIIKVKIVHIMYVIYILLRKRRNKNERTSDRRSYDYSYE